MAGLPFRDRFFTPRVARAVFSPWGILLAIVVAVVAFLAGLPLVAAVLLGAVAWAVKVLLAVPRHRAERIDPFTLQEPWRRFVKNAVSARARFAETVDRLPAGPLQDHLREIATRMDTGVQESWLVAQRGHALQQARRGMDLAGIDRQLARAEDEASASGDDEDPTAAAVVEALRSRRASAERLDQVIARTENQLRVLDARLEQAVTSTLELSTQTGGDAPALGLGDDIDGVVTEMEALRQALDEVQGPTPGALPAGGGE